MKGCQALVTEKTEGNLARYEATPNEIDAMARIIGNNIRKKRLEYNVSMEKTARAIGVSYQTVYRWEKGKVIPSPEGFLGLSKYFKCKPSDFYEGVKGM